MHRQARPPCTCRDVPARPCGRGAPCGAMEGGTPSPRRTLPDTAQAKVRHCPSAVGDASPAEGSLHGTPPAMGELPALPCASAVGDASPAEGSLHGSTPPAMGELPALPCASAVGDASPAEGSLHGSTPPAMGELPALPCASRSGTLPRLKAPCMEARPRRWWNCRHFPARRRSGMASPAEGSYAARMRRNFCSEWQSRGTRPRLPPPLYTTSAT